MSAKEGRLLHPALQLLVPSVRANVVYELIKTGDSLGYTSHTNDANHQFILLGINSHDKRVVHHVQIGKEFAVVPQRSAKDAFRVFSKEERSKMLN
jgi:hypothetical protein